MNAIKTADLRLELEKCAFRKTRIKYSGFIIEVGVGAKVDPWLTFGNFTYLR